MHAAHCSRCARICATAHGVIRVPWGCVARCPHGALTQRLSWWRRDGWRLDLRLRRSWRLCERWLPDFGRVRLPGRWQLPDRRQLPDWRTIRGRIAKTLLPDCWQLTRPLPVNIDAVIVIVAVISPTGRGRSGQG